MADQVCGYFPLLCFLGFLCLFLGFCVTDGGSKGSSIMEPPFLPDCPRFFRCAILLTLLGIMLAEVVPSVSAWQTHYGIERRLVETRKISATLQAWAMAPPGLCGKSPSKISLMLPSPASAMWDRKGSSRLAMRALSL